MIIEGALAIKAAIISERRIINQVMIDQTKQSKDIAFILRLCEEKSIKVVRKVRSEIDALCVGKTHGGIIADCELRTFQDLQSIIKQSDGYILLVEGVEDPFNLGQIIRTAYAAGCDGILLNFKDFSYSEHTLLKSSAGAFDYLPIVLSHDLKVDLDLLKKAHFRIFSALRSPDSRSYTDVDYSGNLVLAVGGELRGLSTKVIDATDVSIEITYPKKVRVALNAVSACALLSFEVLRRRQS